ncbi:MAG TPA: ATP-binding protein [Stellaceae bacterium]|nr:ATP-binding protein [Stellaceae bacterium]
MHKLLQRQLRQAREGRPGGDTDLDALVALVDAAYDEVDRERRIMAHAYQVMRDEHATLAVEIVKKERLSSLGQLTATVAHELRNPLSAIRNSLHALRELTANSGLPLDRAMKRIERSIERSDGIIADLLEYARVRTLARSEVTLDAWLGELLDEQRLPAGIRLERELGAGATVVLIDPDRFRRVLINLVENAAQALVTAGDEAPEKRIRVETAATDMVEIVIEDSGPGIPPEILPRIFEPLFSTKSFGTGLGLPTAKQIVEQHNGTIALGNTPAGGAAARVRLPLARAAQAA